MTDLSEVLEQLKVERAKLDRAIAALSGVVGRKSGVSRNGKRSLSVAARKRIAAAQRARWAKFKAKKAA
jgi:ABC-type transporter Mla subunit MlaD